MIIENGTIEFVSHVGGGLDANGFPIRSSASYGAPIPCQYVASTADLLAKDANGEHYVKAHWSVLVESFEADGVDLQEKERVRLRRRDGSVVGEYSVIRFEPLDAVCQMRITI